MNKEYRYKLASNKAPKPDCPECGAKKHWQKYIDTETNEVLPDQYGRCDNEQKCGYQVLPPQQTKAFFIEVTEFECYSAKSFKLKQGANLYFIPKSVVLEEIEGGLYIAEYFYKDEQDKKPKYNPLNVKYFDQDNNITFVPEVVLKKPKPETVYIPDEVLKQTLSGYEINTFIQNLLTNVSFPFQVQDIESVISLYRLGTVNKGYRTGAVTFPFIDIDGNVRTIQVKQFDQDNNTTKKGTDFLHSMIKKHHTRKSKPLPQWLTAYYNNEKRVSCLFGEHLLTKYPNNPVALVEAPKTAIYGTLYFGFPEQPKNLLWLAVYNLSSLNLEKCKTLKGREVYLFPDLSKDGKAFDLWSNKAQEIQEQLQGARFTVSNLLEQLAPEQDKKDGKDIADYLIQLDWEQFRELKEDPKPEPVEKIEAPQPDEQEIKKPKKPQEDDRIKKLRNRNAELRKEITRAEVVCKNLESTFIQASKKCQVKWYCPEWVKEPYEANKLRELIYWTS